MAERAREKLDYAHPPNTLPPPNDAVGLPSSEPLNQPARYAALVAVWWPFIFLIRAFAPDSLALAFAAGAASLLIAVVELVLIARALRALSYSGRTGPVMGVCAICLAAAAVMAMAGIASFLFPFGSGH